MPVQQPPQQFNMQPNMAQINSPGSGENDGGPTPSPQGQPAPQSPASGGMAPNMQQINSPGSGEKDGGPTPGDQSQNSDQDKQIVQALQQHLDQLQPEDKQFLAAHLTPEFVRAIGLINGPAVANYLNQYADPSKVLVPVPRQIATQVLAKIQSSSKGAAPQGSPQTAAMQPSQPQGQQQASMMTPQPNAPATSPV